MMSFFDFIGSIIQPLHTALSEPIFTYTVSGSDTVYSVSYFGAFVSFSVLATVFAYILPDR